MMVMMTFGAMDRNEAQWIALLDRAGSKTAEIKKKTYAPVERTSIIFAKLKYPLRCCSFTSCKASPWESFRYLVMNN